MEQKEEKFYSIIDKIGHVSQARMLTICTVVFVLFFVISSGSFIKYDYVKDIYAIPRLLDGVYQFLILIIILDLAIFIFIIFKRSIRNYVGVPQYIPPQDLSLLEGAYLYDNRFISKHITAAIIDLIIRGYITVDKLKDDTYLINNYSKASSYRLEEYEELIIADLFKSSKKISLNDKFTFSYSAIEESIQKALKRKDLIDFYLPKKSFINIISYFHFALIFCGAFYIALILKNNVMALMWVLIIDLEIALIYLLYLNISFINEKGNRIKQEIYNFKKYFDLAESKKLEISSSDSSNNVINDKIMPYAVIFNIPFYWDLTLKKCLNDNLISNYEFFVQDEGIYDFIYRAHFMVVILLTIATARPPK